MDYIKNLFTFKGIVRTTIVATTCVVVVMAAIASTNNAPASVVSATEETATDDGSAPGQGARLEDLTNSFIQKPTMVGKLEKEQRTMQVVMEKQTENVTEATTVKETEKPIEVTTEQPTASAVVNENYQVANTGYIVDFSDEDYGVLCKIVEAEAGDQDAEGKILVANVIINRVKSKAFPNTIKAVVFQNNGRTYQFSPVREGGRYYKVSPSANTLECVGRALRGEDISDGALYFAMKTSSNSWFNRKLTFLFKHGAHYFYK